MTPPNGLSLLDAALWYARRGWPVFPLAPRSKQPLYANPHPAGTPERASCRGGCGRDGHGLHDATTDPGKIRAWWSRTRAANVGVATGQPGPDVLDVDVKHGAPGAGSLQVLRGTSLLAGVIGHTRTASGGEHLLFAGSRDQGNGRLPRHGLDFRGVGGYIVVPPSVTSVGEYTALWWSSAPDSRGVCWQAIHDLFAPPRPTSVRRVGGSPRALAALADWVSALPEGNRNSGLHWAACRALESGGGDAELADLEAAAVTAGLGRREAQQTIASARRAKLAA